MTLTFTRKNDGWNITFKVDGHTEVEQCFDPGNYTYTIDAPPPWGSYNNEMTATAGEIGIVPLSLGD